MAHTVYKAASTYKSAKRIIKLIKIKPTEAVLELKLTKNEFKL